MFGTILIYQIKREELSEQYSDPDSDDQNLGKQRNGSRKKLTYTPYTTPQVQLTHAHNLPSATITDLKNKGITGYGSTNGAPEFYHAINTKDTLPKKKYYAKIFGSDLPPICGIHGCSNKPKVLAHGYFSNSMRAPYREAVLVPTCKTCNHRTRNDKLGQNFYNVQSGNGVLANPVHAQKYEGHFYTLDMFKSDPRVMSRKGAGKGSGNGVDGFNKFPNDWNSKQQQKNFPATSNKYKFWKFK